MRAHVLLAEDDDDFRALLVTALRKDGHLITELEDGFELSDYLALTRPEGGLIPTPDLVLSDVRMPGHSGLDVLARARSSGLRCPVLLLTAFPDDELRERARGLGRCVVIEKPVDLDVLRSYVREQ